MDDLMILRGMVGIFMIMILIFIALKGKSPRRERSPNEQIAYDKKMGELNAEREFDMDGDRREKTRKTFKRIANNFGRF